MTTKIGNKTITVALLAAGGVSCCCPLLPSKRSSPQGAKSRSGWLEWIWAARRIFGQKPRRRESRERRHVRRGYGYGRAHVYDRLAPGKCRG